MANYRPNARLIFAKIDLNRDGYLGWHEYLCAAVKKGDKQGELLCSENVDDCFQELDLHKKGFITFDDMERFFGRFVEQQIFEDEVEEVKSAKSSNFSKKNFGVKLPIDVEPEERYKLTKPVWDDIICEAL